MTLDITTIPGLVGVKARPIPLSAITLDDDMQPRWQTSEDAVRRYKDKLKHNKESLPPVLLVNLSGKPLPKDKGEWRFRDKLVVVDGWHRFRAHQELRHEAIPALIIRCTEERARWLAALANMNHGLPLKRGDQHGIFKRYIEAGTNRNDDGSLKTYREIEDDLGGLRGKSSLHRWMQKDFPALAAEMAKREEIEVEEPKTASKMTLAQAIMHDGALGLVRGAKLAAKENKKAIREDILGWALFVNENLGWALGIEPKDLFRIAKDAQWRRQQAEEDLSL